jgi:hypothetical protein
MGSGIDRHRRRALTLYRHPPKYEKTFGYRI